MTLMDLLDDCVDGRRSYEEALQIAKGIPPCLNCTQAWGNCGFGTFHYCVMGYKPDTERTLKGIVDWSISDKQIKERHRQEMTPENFKRYYSDPA
jgi:hypothetical protein